MISPPQIKLSLQSITPSEPRDSFLGIDHCIFTAIYEDGTVSEPFNVDIVRRKKKDAVVIVAYYHNTVYLRSCMRPALSWPESGNLWELPAGLIDPGETPRQAAARECKEELGFDYPETVFEKLDEPVFTSVGLCGEKVHFFSVEVNPKDRKEPTLDGSPMERGAKVEAITYKEAMKLINNGTLQDSKTEIGIRRLIDSYRY